MDVLNGGGVKVFSEADKMYTAYRVLYSNKKKLLFELLFGKKNYFMKFSMFVSFYVKIQHQSILILID